MLNKKEKDYLRGIIAYLQSLVHGTAVQPELGLTEDIKKEIPVHSELTCTDSQRFIFGVGPVGNTIPSEKICGKVLTIEQCGWGGYYEHNYSNFSRDKGFIIHSMPHVVAYWRIRKTDTSMVERICKRFYGSNWMKMKKWFYE